MPTATETIGNVLVAHAPAELTEETAAVLRDGLEGALQVGQVNIVLQMDRTVSYDSAGLTALIELEDELRERGGRLALSGLGEPGRGIFALTRLSQRFALFDSVDEAVSRFRDDRWRPEYPQRS